MPKPRLHGLYVCSFANQKRRLGVAEGVGDESAVMGAACVLLAITGKRPADVLVLSEAIVDAEIPEPAVEVVTVDIYHGGVLSIAGRDNPYAVDNGGLFALAERVLAELD